MKGRRRPTPPKRDALGRYRILQDAEELGSISLVCREANISQTTFFRWEKRYAVSGLIGLENRPIPPSPGRPRRVTVAVAQVLRAHIRAFPLDGCVPLSKRLAEVRIMVSSPTIQKALIGWGLGRRAARLAWVGAGCPPAQVSQPVPMEIKRPMATMLYAKGYFFRGIPGRVHQRSEVARPSLEQIASFTGVALDELRKRANRELWEEARERYWLKLEAFESQKGMSKASTQNSAVTITTITRALRLIGDKVRNTDSLRLVDMVRATSTLRRIYRLMKRILGGDLFVLSETYQKASMKLFQESRWTLPWPTSGRKSLSEVQISLAQKAFFHGLPGDGHRPPKANPSVRQVAEHLGLPARYLQWLALRQGWVDARREVDSHNPEPRYMRIVNQIGVENIRRIIRLFWATNFVILDNLSGNRWLNQNPSGHDLLKFFTALWTNQQLFNEVYVDLMRIYSPRV